MAKTRQRRLVPFKGKKWDSTNKKLVDGDVNVEYLEHQNELMPQGQIISRQAAQGMIKELYWDTEIKGNPDKTVAIAFDRGLLQFILSQKDCEGVRCYLCNKPDDESGNDTSRSLVLVGIDAKRNDLNTTGQNGNYGTIALGANQSKDGEDNGEDTAIIEVGGHDGVGNFGSTGGNKGRKPKLTNAYMKSISDYFKKENII